MDDLVKMMILMSILPKLGGMFGGLGTSQSAATSSQYGNIGGGGEVSSGPIGAYKGVNPDGSVTTIVTGPGGSTWTTPIPDVNSGDEATYTEAVKSQEPFVQVGGAAGLNPYAPSGGDYGL